MTSLEGQREALLYGLRKLARFRRGGFPNVLVATVDDPRGFLDVLGAAPAALRASIGKVVPVDRALRFAGPDTFVDDVATGLAPWLDRLAGRTFFVRVFRRGFRGLIDSTRAEGEIGARLVAMLEARGERPKVSFRDPDVAIAIETLRDEAGVGFLDRALRAAHPLVHVR